MSAFSTPTGIPVAAGEKIRLNSIYDNSAPHTRVMGIMVVYVAPRPDAVHGSLRRRCPATSRRSGTDQPGRTGPIPFRIPLTGLDANGKATTIERPPGPNQSGSATARRSPSATASSAAQRSVIRRGRQAELAFKGSELHNVTLANGPSGIGSANLDGGRTYTQQLRPRRAPTASSAPCTRCRCTSAWSSSRSAGAAEAYSASTSSFRLRNDFSASARPRSSPILRAAKSASLPPGSSNSLT